MHAPPARCVQARTLPLELVFAAPRNSKVPWIDLRQRLRYGACDLAAPVHAGAEDIEDERIYHLGHAGQGGKIVLARQGLGVDRIGGLLGVFLYVSLQTFEINRALAHAIRRASAFREREDITLCAFDDQLAIDHPC